MWRDETWNRLKENNRVSVLIIGAGINGIGTFRDLALQGVNVLMVDKGDFCSGASAASSHMVHGGIRYLENGEFRLVREAVHERNRLIENAPHLVSPLPTTIPIFRTFSGMLNAPLKFLGLLDRPSERGSIVIKLGLMMYDAYTREQGGKAVPPHEVLTRSAALNKYPEVNRDITAVATYYDAAMPMPERIAVEVMLDGENDFPDAKALNYVAAVDLSEGGKGVLLRDELSGETLVVEPELVINAGGPWIDFVNQALGQETEFIGGTKGSHIVLDNQRLYEACKGSEFFFENIDGRIVLIYPSNGKVIVGTSDIFIENPDEAICTPEEIEYFMTFIGKIFPDIPVSPDQIRFQFSGVRPLPSSKGKSAGQVSRDHSNEIVPPNEANGLNFAVFNLIGGKWTTFRAFSEQVTDTSLEYLGVDRKMSTADLAIGGGKDFPKSDEEVERWVTRIAEKTELSRERVRTLLRRYGSRGRDIAFFIADGDDQFVDATGYSERELEYLIRTEKVVKLDDLLLRRTEIGMYGFLNMAVIEQVAAVLANTLNQDETEREAAIERMKSLLVAKHGFTFADS